MFNQKIYLILILFCNLLLAKEGFNPYQEYKWGAKSTTKEFADPIYWIYDFVYLNAYTKSLNTPTKEQIAKILNSIQNQTMEQILLIYPKSSSFVYPNSIIHSCIILGAKHDMESKKQSILCSTKYWLKLTQDFFKTIKDYPQDICRIYDEIFVDENNAFPEVNIAGIIGSLINHKEIQEYKDSKPLLSVLKVELEKILSITQANRCFNKDK